VTNPIATATDPASTPVLRARFQLRRRLAGAVLLASALLGVLVTPAYGQDAQSPTSGQAKLSVVGSDSVEVHLSSGGQRQHGTMSILVANTGDASTTVHAAAFLGNRARGRICNVDQVDVTMPGTPTVAAHRVTELAMGFSLRAGCAGSAGTVVVSGDPGVDATTVGFTLSRQIDDTDLWNPLMGAAIATLLTELALFAYLSRRGPHRFHWVSGQVAVGPAWSFKDSWLTNVAAVGALLGTVLGAGDFLTDLIPGTSTTRLVGLSLIAGGMVTLAPVVYAAFSTWCVLPDTQGHDKLQAVGTGIGMWAAAGATLGGVYVELATIGFLTDAADATVGAKRLVYVLLLAGAVVVALYAIRWTDGVTNGAARTQPDPDSPPQFQPVLLNSTGL
jgi:hypothetical protein